MAEPNNGNTVGLTTKWFGLNLGGKDAIGMLLFIAMLALAGTMMWQNLLRQNEHDQITCMIKLNLYMQQLSPNTPVDWRRMPVDMYSCIPQFLFKPRVGD